MKHFERLSESPENSCSRQHWKISIKIQIHGSIIERHERKLKTFGKYPFLCVLPLYMRPLVLWEWKQPGLLYTFFPLFDFWTSLASSLSPCQFGCQYGCWAVFIVNVGQTKQLFIFQLETLEAEACSFRQQQFATFSLCSSCPFYRDLFPFTLQSLKNFIFTVSVLV